MLFPLDFIDRQMAEHTIGAHASHNLDFVRATAVLLVLFAHVAEQVYPGTIGGVRLAVSSRFGVLLFFVAPDDLSKRCQNSHPFNPRTKKVAYSELKCLAINII
jgi:hypothetical protein